MRFLTRAVEYLEQALALYRTDAGDSKARTHFWLGRFFKDLGDHERAIPHLARARMSPTATPVALLLLAEAHMRSKSYEAARDLFQTVISFCESRRKEGSKGDEVFGREIEWTMSLGALEIWGWWGACLCYAERDVNLEPALKDIKNTKRRLRYLSENERPSTEAACLDCEGWLLLKLGRIDDALDAFEAALILSADAETYMHYALACERKAGGCEGETSRRWEDLTAAMCEHVRDLDLAGLYTSPVASVRKRLGLIEPTSVPGDGAQLEDVRVSQKVVDVSTPAGM